MIASLSGKLKSRGQQTCVVEAGGLGYELHLTQSALAALPPLGSQVDFHTHFHVREDAQQLFGFTSPEEKALFLLLLTVKGVGPKLGMSVLSQLGAPGLVSALKKRDLARLGSPSGVGKKLAERLAVELSDQVKKMDGSDTHTFGMPDHETGSYGKALQALVALGYSSQMAKQALNKTYQQLGADYTKVEDIVKMALKFSS